MTTSQWNNVVRTIKDIQAFLEILQNNRLIGNVYFQSLCYIQGPTAFDILKENPNLTYAQVQDKMQKFADDNKDIIQLQLIICSDGAENPKEIINTFYKTPKDWGHLSQALNYDLVMYDLEQICITLEKALKMSSDIKALLPSLSTTDDKKIIPLLNAKNS